MTDKAALRASALFDLGGRFDDALEGAQGRVHGARGGVAAFSAGAKAVAALEARVNADVEGGELELSEAKVANLWLGRARVALETLGKQAEGRVLMSEGEVRAWKATVELTKKSHDLEVAQIPAARPVPPPELEEAPEGRRRQSVKARRQAEAPSSSSEKPKKAARKKTVRKKKTSRKAG